MVRKYIYRLICLAAAVTLVAACTDDSGDNDPMQNKVALNVYPYIQDQVSYTTRALFDGEGVTGDYHKLVASIPSSIGIIEVTEPTNGNYIMGGLAKFLYQTPGTWTSNVYVTPGLNYKLFGFMPAEIAKSPELKYEDEQFVLTLKEMDPVSASDVCVIVGVHDAYMGSEDSEKDVHDIKTADGTSTHYHNVLYADPGLENSHITLGKFDYTAWPSPVVGQDGVESVNANNTPKYGIYLLMDHLFSRVDFKFMIDITYSQLRKIEITKLEITSNAAETIDATIKLTPTSGTNPIVSAEYVYPATTSTKTVQLFPSINANVPNTMLTNETDVVSLPGYFAPADGSTVTTLNGKFTLRTTYNVYDRKFVPKSESELDTEEKKNAYADYKAAHIVRQGCVSDNKLIFPESFGSLQRGTKYTIQATVIPTYLYQLTDTDLDNPTLTFN